jgi:hypothetical protein
LIGWVVVLGSGSVTSVLLLRSWADCHLGRHAQPFVWSTVAAIGTATASTVLWAVMRKVTGRRGLLVPLALTVLATAVLLCLVLATWYRSPGHPDSLCAASVAGMTPLPDHSWMVHSSPVVSAVVLILGSAI